jgi:hypothetical protein
MLRLAVQKSYSHADLMQSVRWYVLQVRVLQSVIAADCVRFRLRAIQQALVANPHRVNNDATATMLQLSLDEAEARSDFHCNSLRNIVPLSP